MAKPPCFRSYISLHLQSFQSTAELVGARCGLVATANAVETSDDIINLLTNDQFAYTLKVTVATSDKEHLLNDAVVVRRHINDF